MVFLGSIIGLAYSAGLWVEALGSGSGCGN